MRPRKLIVNAVVLATVALGGMWLGCNSSDNGTNPPPSETTIAGPSHLRAYSVDSTSVGLTWSVSTQEADTNLINYLLAIRDTLGNSRPSLTFVKGTAGTVVTGLQEGVVYVFTIRANVTSGAISNDSSTVRWSPAKRLDSEAGAPINVFETADQNHPSGLDIYSPSSDGPVTRSLTGAGNQLIDVFVETQSGSSDLKINSASLSNVIPAPQRITSFCPDSVTSSNDLNTDPRLTPPPASSFSTLSITVPASGATNGRIYWGKTNDGNYFRMLIVYNGTSLISGPTGQRFITVKLSYQRTAGNPYARPIRGHNQQHLSGK